MKKIAICIIFIIAITVIRSSSVFAANFKITCGSSGCSPTSITNFFPKGEIWYPGKTVIRTIQITNTSGTDQKVIAEAINASSTGNLDQVIQFSILKQDSTFSWNNSLLAFYDNGETLLLNRLANRESSTFTFIGHMDLSADNTYQDLTTQFDLIIGYVSTPNPIVPITPTIVPLTRVSLLAPLLVSSVNQNSKTNTLVNKPTISSIQEVKGVSTSNTCNCIWWQILLGEIIVSFLSIFLIDKYHTQKRHTIIGIIGIVLTFIVFRVLNRCLSFSYLIFAHTPSLFCKYFILVDVLIMISIILVKKIFQKN